MTSQWHRCEALGTIYARYLTLTFIQIRADFRFGPSQWETALLCNDVFHWLGASLESAQQITPIRYHSSPMRAWYLCLLCVLSFAEQCCVLCPIVLYLYHDVSLRYRGSMEMRPLSIYSEICNIGLNVYHPHIYGVTEILFITPTPWSVWKLQKLLSTM